jgi:hypothetical protein
MDDVAGVEEFVSMDDVITKLEEDKCINLALQLIDTS